jgi:hypothetical protein
MAGPVLVPEPDPSTSKPTEVPCEPKALVVQAAQLLELPPSQLRPSAKEGSKAGVPSGPLHDELVVVQRAKVWRKIFHRLDPLVPALQVAKPLLAPRDRLSRVSTFSRR